MPTPEEWKIGLAFSDYLHEFAKQHNLDNITLMSYSLGFASGMAMHKYSDEEWGIIAVMSITQVRKMIQEVEQNKS